MWDILVHICRRECCTVHDLCSVAAERRPAHGTLTSALRLLAIDYYRESSTTIHPPRLVRQFNRPIVIPEYMI